MWTQGISQVKGKLPGVYVTHPIRRTAQRRGLGDGSFDLLTWANNLIVNAATGNLTPAQQQAAVSECVTGVTNAGGSDTGQCAGLVQKTLATLPQNINNPVTSNLALGLLLGGLGLGALYVVSN